MKRLALAIILLLSIASSATADWGPPRQPSYLILSAPRRPAHGHQHYTGRGYRAETTTYAYGWFGARPRQHLKRSTGYLEAYLQWTKQ